ncbi:MAG: serine/threonine-protein kinase [Gemmatimonadales bacterium]
MAHRKRQTVEAIFEAALEMPRAEWSAFLSNACGGDPDLRGEVEALLSAHARTSGLLDDLPSGPPADTGEGSARPAPEEGEEPMDAGAAEVPGGGLVGAYRISRELGRGGMGIVYLAERADGQFEQRVSLKMIRRGPETAELSRRFETERQILAALSHPNIAALLDGGVAPDGRPYLVMEYVEGVPIDVYCDRNRLGIESRLKLFCTVARAVQHAHRNLVVHRDLKPSNILVTPEGHPKLLDFGIAKILDPTFMEGGAPETRTGLRLMTPEYASPEQVRAEPVTTATDVYALGVVLYELLTGRRPFQLIGRTPAEAERIITEEEPARPSDAVSRAVVAPEAPGGRSEADGEASKTKRPADPISLARDTEPHRLRRELKGDMDRIVLMALRKEPERRYASAEQLAEDVERYLEGLPVIAQDDSAGYRVAKFVSRHKAGVVAAAIVAVALLAGALSAMVGMVRATRAEAVARAEAETSRQVSDFLVELFEVSDPDEARGNSITAREILDQGAARITSELNDQPLIQARLLLTIGDVYRKLGLFADAEGLLERSLQIRRAELPADHPDVAATLQALATVYGNQDRYEEAADLQRAAIEMEERLYGPEDLRVGRGLTDLGVILLRGGQLDEAREVIERSLVIKEARLDPGDVELAGTLINLASVHRRRGELDEAERLYAQALSIREAGLPEDHPDVARSLNSLAMVYSAQGRLDEAEQLFIRSLAIKEKTLGPDHVDVGNTLGNLAVIHARRGEFEQARELFRRVLVIRENSFGPEHPSVADALHNLAGVSKDLGEWEEAEVLLTRAVAIKERTLPATHPRLAASLGSLGEVYLELEQYGRAEPLLRRTLEIREAAFGPNHRSIPPSLEDLAEALRGLGRTVEADDLRARARELEGDLND